MHTLRRRTSEILEVATTGDRPRVAADVFPSTLILVNVTAIVLGSVALRAGPGVSTLPGPRSPW